MFKLAVVIALIGFVCANPVPEDDDTANTGTAFGGFDNWKIPQIPNIEWPVFPSINPEDIANLKPGPGGSVHAVSSNFKSQTQWVNGKPVTKSGGNYTINRNGVVESGSFPDNADSSDNSSSPE